MRLALAVLLISAGLLAGCGFQPLYGTAPGAASPQMLSEIQIPPLPNRDGQILHNYLMTRLNPYGAPADPRYRLEIALAKQVVNRGIRKDETATRASLTLSADLLLRDLVTRKVVYTGHAVTTNSYDIVMSEFATIAAERDALDRAARVLSNDIRNRVAVFLAQRDAADHRQASESEAK